MALNDDHSKLPNKHYQVSRSEEDASIILAEADTQTASCHELLNMELLRAWEPLYREGAWRNNLGKRPLYHVHC